MTGGGDPVTAVVQRKQPKQSLSRAVFSDGSYSDHFRPEAPDNPFRGLYAAKRRDLLQLAGRRAGSRLLDLGGGPGRIAVPLARAHRVTLGDISSDMLARAGRAAEQSGIPAGNLTLVQLDARDPLPFPSGSFDTVVAADLLVHLPDPLAALREMRRVLAPRGRLLVDTTNRNPLWVLRHPGYVGRRPGRWLRTWRAGGVLPEWAGIVTHHGRAQFREMLQDAGLRIVGERAYGLRPAPKWMLAICEASAPEAATGGAGEPMRAPG